jgi:hypothetical protein
LRGRGGLGTLGLVRLRLVLLPLLVTLLAVPAPALARGGGDDDELRVRGTCARGIESRLRLRARDGEIELRLELRRVPRSSSWRIVVVQERRVVWRGTLRARSREVRVERTLRDLAGADAISVRASGPGGASCRAAGTLAGG